MKTLNENLLYKLTKPALVNTIKELYAENIKLEDKYIHNVPCCNEDDCGLFKEYQQLQQRIDKAITLIQLIQMNDEIDWGDINTLIHILQGNKEKE